MKEADLLRAKRDAALDVKNGLQELATRYRHEKVNDHGVLEPAGEETEVARQLICQLADVAGEVAAACDDELSLIIDNEKVPL